MPSSVTKDCKEWQIDRLKCCTCNLCVEICPVKCLRMENQYSPTVSDKDEAIYTTRAGKGRPARPGIRKGRECPGLRTGPVLNETLKTDNLVNRLGSEDLRNARVV